MRVWNAAEARNGFGDLVDAAVAEGPQLVRRRDGREVVVVSKDAWSAMQPTLLDVLLTSAGEHDEDPLDRALRQARAEAPGTATLRDIAADKG